MKQKQEPTMDMIKISNVLEDITGISFDKMRKFKNYKRDKTTWLLRIFVFLCHKHTMSTTPEVANTMGITVEKGHCYVKLVDELMSSYSEDADFTRMVMDQFYMQTDYKRPNFEPLKKIIKFR